MKKVLLLFLALGLLMVSPVLVQAQDEESTEPTFSISGSVDTYFHKSLTTEEVAPNTSFANLDGFALGMANIVTKYEGEKAGFVADLVFGPRGEDAVFNSGYKWIVNQGNPGNASSQIVNQLYGWFKPTDNLTITMGNFNTFIGYEVISPAVNVNYSTSYMFSYGPFSHTGIKANLEFGEGMNIMAAVMNPTDLTEFNPVNTMTYGLQFGYTNDNGGLWLNALYGDQDGTMEQMGPDFYYDGDGGYYSNGSTFQVDLTTGWSFSDKFYLGLNATLNSTAVGEFYDSGNDVIVDATGDASSFMGFAVYPKLTFDETTALGLRAEYFSEKNGGVGAINSYDSNVDGSVIDFTLSLNKKVGNLTIIPELRADLTSEEDTWLKKMKYGDTPEGTKSMVTFNLAFVYSF